MIDEAKFIRALRTDRFLTYKGRSQNDLLIVLANVFGLDLKTFGKPEWFTGPVAGLV